jgi:hypothetical protein
MDSIADSSPRRPARIAGGAFAITVVPAMLVVQGDLATTAQNMVVTTTNVPLAVIFYELFKVMNRRLAAARARLVPWVQLPALIGEGSLCLWLLVVGINLERWNQQASVTTELQPT